MQLVNYTAFVQLSVAFNFAFVYYYKKEATSDFSLFESLFRHLKELISDHLQKARVLCDWARMPIPSDFAEDEQKLKYKNKAYKVGSKLEKKRNKYEKLSLFKPSYFEQACLILGMYGVLLLFYMADAGNTLFHLSLLFYTECTIILLIYYLAKEGYAGYKYVRKTLNEKDIAPLRKHAHLRPVLFILFIFPICWFYAYMAVNKGWFVGNLCCREEVLLYAAILLPYTALAVCFIIFLVRWLIQFWLFFQIWWMIYVLEDLSLKVNPSPLKGKGNEVELKGPIEEKEF